MTVTISSKYPYDISLPTFQLNESDYVYATEDTLIGYGRFFGNSPPPPIEQQQYLDPDPRSWRAPDPGTGINQAVIKGDFTSAFKQDSLSVEASNLAVKSKNAENSDYTIGWQAEHDPNTMRIVEFNNHKDAGQQFILRKGSASLFLLATPPHGTCPNTLLPKQVHPDNIDPITDLIVVALNNAQSLEVGPGVYHQPLYPIDKANEVMAYSIQGSIHNCTTCDFVKEQGFDVGLRLLPPASTSSTLSSLARFLHQYTFFTLSAGALNQSHLDETEKTKRLELCLHLQKKIELTLLSQESNDATPISIKALQSLIQACALHAKHAHLLSLLSERINWLLSSGRFIRHERDNYLYPSDMLGICFILSAEFNEAVSSLLPAMHYASSLFLSSKSPYRRVLNQIAFMRKRDIKETNNL